MPPHQQAANQRQLLLHRETFESDPTVPDPNTENTQFLMGQRQQRSSAQDNTHPKVFGPN